MSTLRIHIVLAGNEYSALIAHPASPEKVKPIASINAAAVTAKPELLDSFAALVRDAVAALIEARGAGPVLEVRTTTVTRSVDKTADLHGKPVDESANLQEPAGSAA